MEIFKQSLLLRKICSTYKIDHSSKNNPFKLNCNQSRWTQLPIANETRHSLELLAQLKFFTAKTSGNRRWFVRSIRTFKDGFNNFHQIRESSLLRLAHWRNSQKRCLWKNCRRIIS